MNFSARLAEKSGGTMRVDIYSSGQLGSERECIELVQLGGLGMTKTSSSVLEGFAAEFKVFGRNHGDSADYGHGDIVLGPRAPEDVFPRIRDWLLRERVDRPASPNPGEPPEAPQAT